MGRRSEEQYVRVVNEKMIYLNSTAGRSLGDRVNVYECGDMVALAGVPYGDLHVGRKSAVCQGKNICSEQLVDFLRSKYGAQPGVRLPAWKAESENVLLLGQPPSPNRQGNVFDDRFQRVELVYRRRAGERVYVEDNGIFFTAGIREALPRCLALYSDGDTHALLGDPQGRYIQEFRRSKRKDGGAIYSAELARYLKVKYGCTDRSLLLYAKILENGVCFAAKEEALPTVESTYHPKRIELEPFQKTFLRLMKRPRVYISAKAAQCLGAEIGVYEVAGFLALKAERGGPLASIQSGYMHIISSPHFYDAVQKRCPGEKRLCLLEHGDLMVLAIGDDRTRLLPTPEKFRRLNLQPRKMNIHAAQVR